MIITLHKSADPAPLLAFLQEEGICFEQRGHALLLPAELPVDAAALRRFAAVDAVIAGDEPCLLVSRSAHEEDSVVRFGSAAVGGGAFALMAGPCSVESEEQLFTVAKAVKAAGATVLRGGAYKPRTSPYAFQGLRQEGLRLLSLAKAETGLPLCSEVMGVRELEYFDDIDILQIGARNMQNYDLLREAARTRKPILLKRGPAATVREWLLSAEYVLAEGNEQVILCERGIRGFDSATRYTFDLSAIPLARELTHLPVIADPSHATGLASLVPAASLAAAAAGADGLLIEDHNDPLHARSDALQALSCEEFAALAPRIERVRQAARP